MRILKISEDYNFEKKSKAKPKVKVEIRKSEMLLGEKSAFLRFSYDPELISLIKQYPKRCWNGETKCWEITLDELEQLSAEHKEYEFDIETILYNEKIPSDFEFICQPLEHQKKAIEFGLNHPSFLNGDQPGLGKTYESLMVSEIRRQKEHLNHCLILCGVNSLKRNWKREVERFTNQDAFIIGERLNKSGRIKITGSKEKIEDLQNVDNLPYYLILNMESLRNEAIVTLLSDLCVEKINMIVFDECHKCKGQTSIQGKNLLRLNSKYKIGLSGTPIISSPLDIYNFMRWIGVEQRDPYHFLHHFQVYKEVKRKDSNGKYIKDSNGKIKTINIPIGYKHLEEIQSKIDNFMIRRLKTDVLNLPEKIHKEEYLEMEEDQQKLYDELFEKVIENADKIKEMPNPLTAFLRLRQCTVDPNLVSTHEISSVKFDRMEDIVEECIHNGEKIIVFSTFHDAAVRAFRRLKRFNPALCLQDTEDIEKEKLKFRTETSVIIGTIGILGTGHTLTEASTVLFLDQPWTYAEVNQAEDRCHRIGQDKTVRYITLICNGTVDERVYEIVKNKKEMSDFLVDHNKSSLVNFLLNRVQ